MWPAPEPPCEEACDPNPMEPSEAQRAMESARPKRPLPVAKAKTAVPEPKSPMESRRPKRPLPVVKGKAAVRSAAQCGATPKNAGRVVLERDHAVCPLEAVCSL